jgi:hypothetical protein
VEKQPFVLNPDYRWSSAKWESTTVL